MEYINHNYNLRIRVNFDDNNHLDKFVFYNKEKDIFLIQDPNSVKYEGVMDDIDKSIMNIIFNIYDGVIDSSQKKNFTGKIKVRIQIYKAFEIEENKEYINLNSKSIDNNDFEITWHNIKTIGDYIGKCLKFIKHNDKIIE